MKGKKIGKANIAEEVCPPHASAHCLLFVA